jgi:hypothetical protein
MQNSQNPASKTPAPTGAKGSVLGFDRTKTNQTTTISTEAETFRTSVTWTRRTNSQDSHGAEIQEKQFLPETSPTGTTSVKFAAQDVPLDPQWLGIWLGDGSSSACKMPPMIKKFWNISTIAGTYGMQVKQQTYAIDYVITNGNAGLVVDVPYLLTSQNAMALMDTDENFTWRALSEKCGCLFLR